MEANQSKPYENDIDTQCFRLLGWLKNGEKLTTYEIRARGVMHAAGRIKNLREQGYRILTHRVWQDDANRVPHYFAQYVLLPSKKGENS